MMFLLEVGAYLLISAGVFFFFAGSLGMLRLKDLHSRLHAVTKADTLGLGLVVFGLCLLAESWQAVAIMVLIWLLVLTSSAIACQLLARYCDPAEEADPDGD